MYKEPILPPDKWLLQMYLRFLEQAQLLEIFGYFPLDASLQEHRRRDVRMSFSVWTHLEL